MSDDNAFERLVLDQLKEVKQEVRDDIRQIATTTSANRAKIAILEQALKAEDNKAPRDYSSMLVAGVTGVLSAVGSFVYLIFELISKKP